MEGTFAKGMLSQAAVLILIIMEDTHGVRIKYK